MTSIPEEEKSLEWDLDEVLTDLKFGPFQLRNLVFIGLMILFSNLYPLSFSLTAADLDYRCLVPECENDTLGANPQFSPSWLSQAIPSDKNQKRLKCKRYKPSTTAQAPNNSQCATAFDSVEAEDCTKFVFATDEVTIVKDFEIFCENRQNELTRIGTINNIGQFIGIPLFGLISDRYGRKILAILSCIMSAIFGVLRGFSTSYWMFAVFEFLDAFFGSAIYGTAFILGIELVNPKMRSVAATIIGLFYPLGAVIMGIVAWYFRDWRKMLIFSYSPGLLFISYFWVIPESIRWLQMNGYHSKATAILKKISASNNIELPEKVFEKQKESMKNQVFEEKKQSFWKPILTAIRTRHILFRLISCSFCWFANTLIYYGLSINSVDFPGNRYLNFILVSAVEIPAFVLSGFVMDKVPRRLSQCTAFFLSGAACIVSEFIPAEQFELRLALFLISKFLITISFNIMYIYTAEMFPTELRLSLCGFASMFGRVGSMIAPQTVLLKNMIADYAPVLLFGVTSVIAGGLSTSFPETLNKKLPDTINQAKLEEKS